MKIETKYNINDKVYINELKVWGRILAIHINSNFKYNIRFFDGKNPQETYFLEEELSSQEDEGVLGFKTNINNV